MRSPHEEEVLTMKDVDSRVISLAMTAEALRMDEFTKEENMKGKSSWEHQRSWGEGKNQKS